MSVFRIKKTDNYTVMSNHHLRNKKLSYKAKGLLSFMLSLPDDWDYSMNGLVAVSKEQIKSVRSTIKELEDFGYVERIKKHTKKGLYQYEYNIYEYPYHHKGSTDDPITQLEPQIKTNKPSIKYKDKLDKQNIIVKELIRKEFIEESDLEIYRYSELFDEVLENYTYQEVITVTNYIVRRWLLNKAHDEDQQPIQNKFSYFKASLLSNLKQRSEDNAPEWFSE